MKAHVESWVPGVGFPGVGFNWVLGFNIGWRYRIHIGAVVGKHGSERAPDYLRPVDNGYGSQTYLRPVDNGYGSTLHAVSDSYGLVID
ncbi:MAG: hypothetical protein ACPIOQ_27340, partial [Promethearchaeia archaeon]